MGSRLGIEAALWVGAGTPKPNNNDSDLKLEAGSCKNYLLAWIKSVVVDTTNNDLTNLF